MENINFQYFKWFAEFKNQLKVFYKKIPKCLNIIFFKDFCKKSQADKIYWHLQQFGQITNLQCHAIYGIRHAPRVIKDIRERLLLEGNKYRIENIQSIDKGGGKNVRRTTKNRRSNSRL